MKAPELKAALDVVIERVENLRRELDAVVKEVDRLDSHRTAEKVFELTRRMEEAVLSSRTTSDTFNVFHRETERELALLKQKVEDLRLNWEKWLMRLWALVGPISGVLLAYFLGIKR